MVVRVRVMFGYMVARDEGGLSGEGKGEVWSGEGKRQIVYW